MNFGIQRGLVMFSLLLAGEAVFTLPFHIARYFRPTFVEVLGITQTQLGELFTTYGIVAMFAYLLGGCLADRFSARKLLAFSLVSTAVSGFFLARIPAFISCVGSMPSGAHPRSCRSGWSLRATREWGGPHKQGEAFGILDGGRGVIAAVMASAALWLISTLLPVAEAGATLAQRTVALRSTIYFYTGATLLAAVCVWLLIPATTGSRIEEQPDDSSAKAGRLRQVIRMPVIWLHAVVILAAYSAYKGFDFFSQFAYDVWGWSDVESAKLSTTATWIRPVAAVGAGLLADRWRSSRVIMIAFLLTGAGYATLPWISPGHALLWLLWTNVLTVCLGIFALCGIYFAVLEEAQIPRTMTGTAIGVVSFIGFVPEIFIYYSGGRLIDHWSGGPTGYRVFFTLLACGCLVGLTAAFRIRTVRSDTHR